MARIGPGGNRRAGTGSSSGSSDSEQQVEEEDEEQSSSSSSSSSQQSSQRSGRDGTNQTRESVTGTTSPTGDDIGSEGAEATGESTTVDRDQESSSSNEPQSEQRQGRDGTNQTRKTAGDTEIDAGRRSPSAPERERIREEGVQGQDSGVEGALDDNLGTGEFGIEENSASRHQQAAQGLEQQAIEQSPALDDEGDVRVVMEGDQLVTQLTEQGGAKVRRRQAQELEQQFIEENEAFDSRDEVQVTRQDGQLVAEPTARGESAIEGWRRVEASQSVEAELEERLGQDVTPGEDFEVDFEEVEGRSPSGADREQARRARQLGDTAAARAALRSESGLRADVELSNEIEQDLKRQQQLEAGGRSPSSADLDQARRQVQARTTTEAAGEGEDRFVADTIEEKTGVGVPTQQGVSEGIQDFVGVDAPTEEELAEDIEGGLGLPGDKARSGREDLAEFFTTKSDEISEGASSYLQFPGVRDNIDSVVDVAGMSQKERLVELGLDESEAETVAQDTSDPGEQAQTNIDIGAETLDSLGSFAGMSQEERLVELGADEDDARQVAQDTSDPGQQFDANVQILSDRIDESERLADVKGGAEQGVDDVTEFAGMSQKERLVELGADEDDARQVAQDTSDPGEQLDANIEFLSDPTGESGSVADLASETEQGLDGVAEFVGMSQEERLVELGADEDDARQVAQDTSDPGEQLETNAEILADSEEQLNSAVEFAGMSQQERLVELGVERGEAAEVASTTTSPRGQAQTNIDIGAETLDSLGSFAGMSQEERLVELGADEDDAQQVAQETSDPREQLETNIEFAEMSQQERLGEFGLNESEAEDVASIQGDTIPLTGAIGPGGAARSLTKAPQLFRIGKEGAVTAGLATAGAGIALGANELEVEEGEERSEVEAGESLQEQEEIPVPQNQNQQEVEVPSGGVFASELAVTEAVFSPEITQATGQANDAGGSGQEGEETVVPTDYPIPGRDIPADRSQDYISDSDPEAIAGTSPAVTEGAQRQRDEEAEDEEEEVGVPDDPFLESDRRLYDPSREFGDQKDISRSVDPTSERSPSQQDIGSGIAGTGTGFAPARGETVADNFQRYMEEREQRQRQAERHEVFFGDQYPTGEEEINERVGEAQRPQAQTDSDTISRAGEGLFEGLKAGPETDDFLDVGSSEDQRSDERTREREQVRDLEDQQTGTAAEVDGLFDQGLGSELSNVTRQQPATQNRSIEATETGPSFGFSQSLGTGTPQRGRRKPPSRLKLPNLDFGGPDKKKKKGRYDTFERTFEFGVAEPDEIIDDGGVDPALSDMDDLS